MLTRGTLARRTLDSDMQRNATDATCDVAMGTTQHAAYDVPRAVTLPPKRCDCTPFAAAVCWFVCLLRRVFVCLPVCSLLCCARCLSVCLFVAHGVSESSAPILLVWSASISSSHAGTSCRANLPQPHCSAAAASPAGAHGSRQAAVASAMLQRAARLGYASRRASDVRYIRRASADARKSWRIGR